MEQNNTTEDTISSLNAESAFALIKFYEDAASVVKGRTWTITAWVLTINSALFTFCFKLYTNHSEIHGFSWIVFAICLAGVLLCLFLVFLIRDQGNHLSHYWTKENKIGAWNNAIRDLVLNPKELKKVITPEYSAPFPKFCRRLIFLSYMYAGGFVGTFVLMWFLVKQIEVS